MLFVVDDEEEHAEKEDCEDVAEDYFPLEVVEVRHEDVDEGGESEEDSAEAAADGVGQSEGPAVFLQAGLGVAAVILDLLIMVTLHHNLHHLSVAGHPVIDTEVAFKSALRVVERPVADEKMSVCPGLDYEGLTLPVGVEEVLAETEVGEAAAVWEAGEVGVVELELAGVGPQLAGKGGGAAHLVVSVEQQLGGGAALANTQRGPSSPLHTGGVRHLL